MNDDLKRERHAALIAEGLEAIESYRDYLDLAWLDGLERYLRDKIPTGSFLRAVLENDLREAIGRAHPSMTLAQIKTLMELLYNFFPSPAFGSPEKVAQWLGEAKE